MGQYTKLLNFIGYFENKNTKYGKWVREPGTFPYFNYTPKFNSFIHCFYETDLSKQDYLEYLEKHVEEQYIDVIEQADMELLKALFTYYVRQERFIEGLWAGAAKDGVFLKLLKRLEELEGK
ncbi:MAG: hypothetical protein JXR56_06330 [Candidatus Cloacimonetes bacterium]|nr:hypothetical protein [Candidatus Cloacimonadota bacterium]